jgi:lysophospholipase L1-like esterase
MRLIGLVLLLLTLTHCGVNGTGVLSPVNGRLLVYGDSISQAFESTSPGYAVLVSASLSTTLVNNSIGGTSLFSANQYPALMQAQLDSHDTIMFAPGVNDAILYGSDSTYPARYQDGLRQVLYRIHSLHIHAYIGTPNRTCDEQRFVSNKIVDVFANINRQLVAELRDSNIQLIDYNARFNPSWENTIDCYHPNQQGYREMFKVWLSFN